MSRERETASDTGPLITLEKLSDGFRFIRLPYVKIVIPRAVLDELSVRAAEACRGYRRRAELFGLELARGSGWYLSPEILGRRGSEVP